MEIVSEILVSNEGVVCIVMFNCFVVLNVFMMLMMMVLCVVLDVVVVDKSVCCFVLIGFGCGFCVG